MFVYDPRSDLVLLDDRAQCETWVTTIKGQREPLLMWKMDGRGLVCAWAPELGATACMKINPRFAFALSPITEREVNNLRVHLTAWRQRKYGIGSRALDRERVVEPWIEHISLRLAYMRGILERPSLEPGQRITVRGVEVTVASVHKTLVRVRGLYPWEDDLGSRVEWKEIPRPATWAGESLAPVLL